MKLGLSVWSYAKAWKSGAMDIPAFIREAARLGADGVELLDVFWRDREREQDTVLDALRDTNLPVCAYSVSNDFALPDRANQLQIVTEGVDTAVQFGAPIVRVFAGNFMGGMDTNAALVHCVEGLSDAAAYAQQHGVTLALENHGRLAGRSDQIAFLLDAVNSPALCASPDTANFLLVHECPHDAVDVLAPRAAYAHLKDFRLVMDNDPHGAFVSIDDAKYAGVALGEGDVDLADCVQSLKAAGTEWVSVEYEGHEDPQTAVPRCMANARALLGTTL